MTTPNSLIADRTFGVQTPLITPTPGTIQQSFTIDPLGQIRVVLPMHTRLVETFDSGAWDTINKWVITSGGGGVTPSASVGTGVLNSGTTANGFSKVTTLNTPGGGPNFKLTEPGHNFFFDRIQLPAILPTSGYLCWGSGTSLASPTIANPVTQGMLWEVTTAGALVPVIYQTGTRVPAISRSPTDNSGLPTLTPQFAQIVQDGTFRKYFRYFRGDYGIWAWEDPDNVVAYFTRGAGGPDINSLPLLYQAISNGSPAVVLNVAGLSVAATSGTSAATLLNNGALAYDEQRGNMDGNSSLTVLAAQGTGTVNSSDQLNVNAKGLKLFINITAITAGSLTVTIQGKDVLSGTYYTVLASAALASTGFTVLTVYPNGIAAVANTSAPDILPRTWRVSSVVATGPVTATIGYSVIL